MISIPPYTKATALIVPAPEPEQGKPYWETVLKLSAMADVQLVCFTRSVDTSGVEDIYHFELFLYDPVTGLRTENREFVGSSNEYIKFLPALVVMEAGNVDEISKLVRDGLLPKDRTPRQPGGQIPVPKE